MISKDNTADVEAETDDGSGNGLEEPFVPNPDIEEPTISYRIKAVNQEVKFVSVAFKATNVQTVKIIVVDSDNNYVAPFNPKEVNCDIILMYIMEPTVYMQSKKQLGFCIVYHIIWNKIPIHE